MVTSCPLLFGARWIPWITRRDTTKIKRVGQVSSSNCVVESISVTKSIREVFKSCLRQHNLNGNIIYDILSVERMMSIYRSKADGSVQIQKNGRQFDRLAAPKQQEQEQNL